jgi:hypothetical protein
LGQVFGLLGVARKIQGDAKCLLHIALDKNIEELPLPALAQGNDFRIGQLFRRRMIY